MIITEKKEYQEILENLEDESRFIIIGCGLCATTVQTGGEKQVQELKDLLEKNKKKVLAAEVIEAVCDERQVRLFLNKNKETLKKTDAIIVLACGAGVQSFPHIDPEIKVHSGLNTLFLGTEKRLGNFNQFCSLCGDCILDLTNGVCTITRCPKSYTNGPCGGSKEGKCEAHPDNDCVWNIISKNPLKKRLRSEITKRRNHNKQFHPRLNPIKKA